jgi:hypothetical protein
MNEKMEEEEKENKELKRIIEEITRELEEERRKKEEKEKKDGQKQYKYFSTKSMTRYLISIAYKNNVINYMRLEKVYIPNYPDIQKFRFEMIKLKIRVNEIKDDLVAITFIGETKKGENDIKYPFEVKYSHINTTVYVCKIPGFVSRYGVEESIKQEGVEKTFMYIVKSLQNYLTLGFPEV